MAGTNPIATFTLTNMTNQTGTTYPLAIDGNFAVLQRFGGNFAAHAAANPNMTVVVDPGHLFVPSNPSLLEIGTQTSATITAPSLLPRIDRIVADQTTGIIAVVTGSESSSPTAPALPGGKMPIAQVALQTSTTAISNAMITDERALWGIGTGGGFQSQATIASSATTDLGASGSNNVFVSGTTTISSFGSGASTAAPLYIVTFGGNLTLTNSPHLLLPGQTNQLVAPNDALLANYLGSGNWQVLAYWSSVSPSVPVGAILDYAGTAVPSGFAACIGQSLATAQFSNLFAAIGYTYGGSGANFNVPDCRGRVGVGLDPSNTTGRATGLANGVSASTLGNVGGQQAHTLTTAELPAHTHTVNNQSTASVATGGAYGATVAVPGGAASGSTGGGTAHNVIQPSIVFNKIIKF